MYLSKIETYAYVFANTRKRLGNLFDELFNLIHFFKEKLFCYYHTNFDNYSSLCARVSSNCLT